jgi:hypothetical protein
MTKCEFIFKSRENFLEVNWDERSENDISQRSEKACDEDISADWILIYIL